MSYKPNTVWPYLRKEIEMYERHKGDDLLSKDRRLKYSWQWSRVAARIPKEEIRKWTHFQVSEAYVGDWEINATQWGAEPVYYTASIRYRSNYIKSVGKDRETGFITRIDAQIAAEKLLVDWIQEQSDLALSKP